MTNKLKDILAQKQNEVANLYQMISAQPHHPIAKILRNQFHDKRSVSFARAIDTPSLSIIAEIKRRSPSKGALAPICNSEDLAKQYIEGGADAISVLTDQTFFGGSLDDLLEVSQFATHQNVPVLRKDFIIDPIQIAEAAFANASAVLLIVAVLGEKTKSLLAFAHSLQLDVLVEVHEEHEIDIALSSGAKIIGINNRNLKTFMVDTDHAFYLKEKIPAPIITVAESGITTPMLANRYHAHGFHAVLIGETLVKSNGPKQFIEACRHE